MANPSGNHHQEQNNVPSSCNGNLSNANSPEDSGEMGTLKHNPAMSMDWTDKDQVILEEGLSKYASKPKHTCYTLISEDLGDKTAREVAWRVGWLNLRQQLDNKTVQDLALPVGWMNKNGKRRKDEHDLTKKSKDKKDRVSDPAEKSSHFFARPNVPPFAPPMMAMDIGYRNSYKEIGGPTGELLKQNEQALLKISENLGALQPQENINLFYQTRKNILKIMNDLNDMPELMQQMPPLPVKVNEELASTILPRTTSYMQL